jgi:enoyl-CoA hydratase/carnithine racemase
MIYEVKEMVATITINRPDARNSLTMQLMKDLCAALEEAERDPGVGVVVITASGDKFFCPGLDLNWAKNLFNNTHDVWVKRSNRWRRV